MNTVGQFINDINEVLAINFLGKKINNKFGYNEFHTVLNSEIQNIINLKYKDTGLINRPWCIGFSYDEKYHLYDNDLKVFKFDFKIELDKRCKHSYSQFGRITTIRIVPIFENIDLNWTIDELKYHVYNYIFNKDIDALENHILDLQKQIREAEDRKLDKHNIKVEYNLNRNQFEEHIYLKLIEEKK